MRTYGRVTSTVGVTSWVQVNTDPSGDNDAVWLTTLAQCLKLNLGESPFFADYGIPQYQTIVTQVFPDYYVSQTQVQFSSYFASLAIQRVQSATSPIYNVTVVTHRGSTIQQQIPT